MNQTTPPFARQTADADRFTDTGVLLYLERLNPLVETFGDDEALRARAEADPKSVLLEYGLDFPQQFDVQFVANTAEVFHLALPPDPNRALADEDLNMVAGGTTAGTAGCASTVACVGTAISTVGSASSVGSMSTAGTAS